MSGKQDVTVVLATYNRSRALRRTLTSLQAQVGPDWTALVIGDRCTDDTFDMIDALQDPRIQFINLPKQFGEQAGPNSVGLALAETDYVALLNHDDLWVRDHLDRALSTLATTGCDIYMARALSFGGRGPNAKRFLFRDRHALDRNIETAYHAPWYAYEPISSWVGHKAAFTRLGPMPLATTIHIVPVEAYIRRMAQMELRVAFGEAVTVYKLANDQESYAYDPPVAQRLANILIDGREEELSELIESDFWLMAKLGAGRRGLEPKPIADSDIGDPLVLERDCGIDLTSLSNAAKDGPNLIRELHKRRTHRDLGEQPSIEEAVDYAKSQLN